jgi:hypothetical protein
MSKEQMEERIQKLEDRLKELESRCEHQEKIIQTHQDIEQIKRLQRAYGYYLEHWMTQEIIALFSDGPDVSLMLGAGTYLGKKGVRRYFEFGDQPKSSEFLHTAMQLSGMVDVAPDNNTAKGRWYGFGAVAFPRPEGVRQMFFNGIYGGEYVKEDGVWKIQKLRFDETFTATPAKGWVRPERVLEGEPLRDIPVIPGLKVDIPRTTNTRYPSGLIFPFHYKHPVTGKQTTEDVRNAALLGS